MTSLWALSVALQLVLDDAVYLCIPFHLSLFNALYASFKFQHFKALESSYPFIDLFCLILNIAYNCYAF